MKRKKDIYIRVKIKYEKTKKEASPKKNKKSSSKGCDWHNKLNNVKNKDVPGALKQLAIDFSPTSVHDVAEVLLEKLCRRGGISVSTDDVEDLLKAKHFCILSEVNENNRIK
eukprot:13412029-Ditylum_brightwellii.AAC.2